MGAYLELVASRRRRDATTHLARPLKTMVFARTRAVSSEAWPKPSLARHVSLAEMACSEPDSLWPLE